MTFAISLSEASNAEQIGGTVKEDTKAFCKMGHGGLADCYLDSAIQPLEASELAVPIPSTSLDSALNRYLNALQCYSWVAQLDLVMSPTPDC